MRHVGCRVDHVFFFFFSPYKRFVVCFRREGGGQRMTRTSGQVAERDAGDRGNLSVASTRREPSERRARRRGSRSCRHTSTCSRRGRLSDMSHALNLRADVDRQQRSWLGARRAGPERPWIRHASTGRIARYRVVRRARRRGRRGRRRWKGPNRSVVVRFGWVRP